MNPTTLAALAAFPSQLDAHYAAIPQAFRHWAPSSWEGVPSEAFTAIEQLCHVRDIETEGYHVRFRRTLAETHPTLASIDSEPLAIERNYGAADAATVLAEFRLARVQTMEIVSQLSETQLARTAVFEGYGPLTMRSLIHYLCSHDQQHLAGLQWLAGKIDAAGLTT
ncbi:DinB family protein [Variovorax sp. Root473]|uniref:DinB family protein n=1 Tax=Variovorax sp. Root473 TaxID=1736541 RepID=UPI0006F4D9E7|nr:DinB family protein [Variovorax sp. Root473]KQX91265.1 damage-inducible protein DinB [Variovorax sp. Root473]